jgi:RNA polymerase sigma-70 factor (sigma-E family)
MTDEASFAAFVREHSRSLYSTAFLLTADSGAAEELLQDTLVRLYPDWTRVLAARSAPAYVRRAIVNRFLSAKRRPAARDVARWDVPDAAADLDVAAIATDRLLLWQLLTELPYRPRAAVVLRYFHDLPDGEIATALGCRVATVRSLISRAVHAMRARSTQCRGVDRR